MGLFWGQDQDQYLVKDEDFQPVGEEEGFQPLGKDEDFQPVGEDGGFHPAGVPAEGDLGHDVAPVPGQCYMEAPVL